MKLTMQHLRPRRNKLSLNLLLLLSLQVAMMRLTTMRAQVGQTRRRVSGNSYLRYDHVLIHLHSPACRKEEEEGWRQGEHRL